jgi:hypothetical protein
MEEQAGFEITRTHKRRPASSDRSRPGPVPAWCLCTTSTFSSRAALPLVVQGERLMLARETLATGVKAGVV